MLWVIGQPVASPVRHPEIIVDSHIVNLYTLFWFKNLVVWPQVFFTIIYGWPPTLPTPLKGMTEKWNIHMLFVLRAKSEVLRTRDRVYALSAEMITLFFTVTTLKNKHYRIQI